MPENKTIGLLFGMEDTFPWALINEINGRNAGIEAMPVKISAIRDTDERHYDLILDRISHEVPFYRTFLKVEAAKGATIFSSPFWAAADDKFFNNIVAMKLGVAVPKTVIIPHKQHPPGTQDRSFRNLEYVDWDAIFDYLGFPIFMKPAYGGGWKDVYKIDNREEFFSAYDQTRDLTMMAQEAIDFTEYYRCYCVGRERVFIMRYDPKAPFHERYVRDNPAPSAALKETIERQCIALCKALGYDLNTLEFAVRGGIPYAIDFMNSAPDADVHSVGEQNFEWIVRNMADVLIARVNNPRPLEITGNWPEVMRSTATTTAGTAPAGQPAPARPKPASTAGTKKVPASTAPGATTQATSPKPRAKR